MSAALLAAVAGLCAAAAVLELGSADAPVRARTSASRRARRPLSTLLAWVGRVSGLRFRPPGDLATRIDAAGLPARVGVPEVMALKAGAAVVGLLLAVPLAASAPGRLWIVVLPGLPAAGYVAPDLALGRHARRRGRRIAAELPEVLDLLRVVVAAGLPAGRALGEVGARCGGLLAGEMRAAAGRIALGQPREEAMERLVDRCPAPGVAALAVAFGRAERHGTPLAPALADLAADTRAERARRLRDRADRAAPKIQLVVALLLVPAVMLAVAAVMVTSLAGA